MTTARQVKDFKAWAKEITHTYDVLFNLDFDAQYINVAGNQCNGIFADTPIPQLLVAGNKPQEQWLATLAHEICHLLQWVEQSPVWLNTKNQNIDKMDMLSLWLDHHVELNDTQLTNYITSIRDVELDCEKRAVSLIIEFDLPIDTKQYIQKANAYVLFYNHLMETRQWYTIGNEPYNNPDIWTHMPPVWLASYSPEFCQSEMALFTSP